MRFARLGTPGGFGLPAPVGSVTDRGHLPRPFWRGGASRTPPIIRGRAQMRIVKAIAALAFASGAAACASVTSGTSQTLGLDTVPPGADCTLTRNGMFVGRVNPTPGTVTVHRARDDITVACTLDGFQIGTFVNKAGLEGATFGNIIAGGLVGIAIDEASGANRKYDAAMRITLASNVASQEPSPQATPASAPGAPAQEQLPQPLTSMSPLSAQVKARPLAQAMEPAAFRCPPAGTVVRTSTGQQYTFTQVNGMRCGYTDQNGVARERYAMFADGLGKSARQEMDAIWPLRIGNRIEFDVIDIQAGQDRYSSDRMPTKSYQESFEIVRQESVTVPAGTFDTFVVEWREKQVPTGGGEALITFWYAPQVGYFVRSSVQIITDNALDPFFKAKYSGMDYEATTVTLPRGQSVWSSR